MWAVLPVTATANAAAAATTISAEHSPATTAAAAAAANVYTSSISNLWLTPSDLCSPPAADEG